MQTQTASLHAGLLARKGEARPSAQGDAAIASRSGNLASISDVVARREPMATGLFESRAPGTTGKGRCIELPRMRVAAKRLAPSANRRQVHARLDGAMHLRLKVAAVRLGRTQQDLVTSALDAYLSFLDDDVFPPRCGDQNAGD